jgi:hypothetical protein
MKVYQVSRILWAVALAIGLGSLFQGNIYNKVQIYQP